MLSKKYIKEVRNKALRRHIWYNTLDTIERGIINLTINIVDNVQSLTLAKEIMKIIKKLLDASKSEFTKHYENIGLQMAKNRVSIAVNFGNTSAKSWLMNESFAKLITMNDFYNPTGWK